MEDNLKYTSYEFLELLSSKQAVPGGGGASALVGALGAALGLMVGNLTLGKKKYAGVQDDIQALMADALKLRGELAGCVAEDAAAFEPLSKAYGLDKDAPGRAETLERCLKEAARPPMKILELSCRCIDLLEGFAEKGSRLAISDAATGAAFCRAAVTGALINVKVNTRLMKDAAYAAGVEERADALAAEYVKKADSIIGGVCGRL